MAGVRGDSATAASGLPGALPFLVRLAAATAMVIGGTFLIAWLGGAAARWSAAGVITMKTNMALALTLAGAALLLLGEERPAPRRRVVAILASAVVLLIGLLTLSEHLLDLDLGVDELLAKELPGAAATARPNRIGLPGATSLSLLGAGLLALAWRRRAALYLGLATALLVLVPAVGYLYGIGSFYSGAKTGIAWATVVALLSLAVSLVLAEARRADLFALWRDDPGGALFRRMLLPSVLIPVGLGYLMVLGERLGLFDPPTGAGLFALSLVVLFSALLWQSAARLSAAAAEGQRVTEALGEREERLRGAVQRIESMLENSPLAVVEWSTSDFRVSRWSEEATRVFGWTAEEVVGRRVDDLSLVHPDDWPLVEQVMADMLSGRRPRNVSKNRNVRRDGSVIHCEWYNSTVTDATGKLTGVLSLVLDVTERNANEAALREADQRKSEFLGVLSHELRNPLAPIRNSIHLLDVVPPGSPQAVRAREVIRRQTDHLTRLVDDLLDLTRITQGKIELQRVRLDLRRTVRQACEDHRSLFQAQRIELEVEAPAPVWIDGDETRIAQVVGNLLLNAAKFSLEGSAVSVLVGTADGAGELRVRDHGIGMAPDLMPRLFEPFVQAEGGLARSKGGLGLGLALVKGLVALHGGSVKASSGGPGLGSEFVVRLPLAAPARAPEPGLVASAEAGALEILIIEDNADAAETLAEVLRAEGHQVRLVADGAAGIACVREREPDVVLCDIGLPGMDGYEVARTLRGEGLARSARLIALTGYALPSDRARAEAAGFDAHLPKPPALGALLAMLRGPRPA